MNRFFRLLLVLAALIYFSAHAFHHHHDHPEEADHCPVCLVAASADHLYWETPVAEDPFFFPALPIAVIVLLLSGTSRFSPKGRSPPVFS